MLKPTSYGWPRLMRLPTAAAYLDMTPSTFLGEVAHDRLPTSVMFGGRERWDRHAIDKALDGNPPERDWESKQPGLNPDLPMIESPKKSGERPPVHTVAALAERWGCSTAMVYGLIHGGELEAFKVSPRLYRVRHDRLLAYEAKYGPPS